MRTHPAVPLSIGLRVCRINRNAYYAVFDGHFNVIKEGIVTELNTNYVLIQWDGDSGSSMCDYYELTAYNARCAAIRHGVNGVTLRTLAMPIAD